MMKQLRALLSKVLSLRLTWQGKPKVPARPDTSSAPQRTGSPLMNLSREQFREWLFEALEDPATARLVARRLLLPVFPIQGAACPYTANNIGPGSFGTDAACSSGDYSFPNSKVGIGTPSPAYPLDVVGGSARVTNPTGTTQLVVSGHDSSGRLGQDAAGFFLSSDTNGKALRFLTNNGSLHEWMRITSAGNVGIGTTTPAATLDVAGNINASGSVVIGGTTTKQVSSGPEAISLQTSDGLQPPAAPIVQTPSGSLPAGTYHVTVTYVNANGETIQSSETSRSLSAGYQLLVKSPAPANAPAGNATGWNVYISVGAGINVIQNSSPYPNGIPIGTDWPQTASPATTPIPNQVNLTNNTSRQRRVLYWGGLPSDANAKALCDYQNWLEWGPGEAGRSQIKIRDSAAETTPPQSTRESSRSTATWGCSSFAATLIRGIRTCK